MNPDFEDGDEDVPGMKSLDQAYFHLCKEKDGDMSLRELHEWYLVESQRLYDKEQRRIDAIEQAIREKEYIFNSAINLLKSLPPINGERK